MSTLHLASAHVEKRQYRGWTRRRPGDSTLRLLTRRFHRIQIREFKQLAYTRRRIHEFQVNFGGASPPLQEHQHPHSATIDGINSREIKYHSSAVHLRQHSFPQNVSLITGHDAPPQRRTAISSECWIVTFNMVEFR